jgi:DUF4097 and DUF4098 domain-containing protein YvlB
MKKKTMIWVIAAIILLLAGSAISAASLSLNDWDFGRLATVKTVTNRHQIGEDFSSISIIADTEDIRILPSPDTIANVVFTESEKQKHSATVMDETLNISVNDTREWYDKIGIFSDEDPSITLYLPKNTYRLLKIDSDTSDISISSDFTFNDIKISVTTGDIEIENVTCTENIDLNVTTGDIELSGISCNNLKSTGSTGEMEMQNVIAQNTFNITRTTGDIELESCDAAEITVTTDTGDVSGSLKSGKIFVTSTDTGIVKVPKTSSGGKCEITTDTGNIIFSMHN